MSPQVDIPCVHVTQTVEDTSSPATHTIDPIHVHLCSLCLSSSLSPSLSLSPGSLSLHSAPLPPSRCRNVHIDPSAQRALRWARQRTPSVKEVVGAAPWCKPTTEGHGYGDGALIALCQSFPQSNTGMSVVIQRSRNVNNDAAHKAVTSISASN